MKGRILSRAEKIGQETVRASGDVRWRNRLLACIALLAGAGAGVFLFLTATLYMANASVLSASRNEELLSAFDVYSEVGTTLESTIESFIPATASAEKSMALQVTDSAQTEKILSPALIKLNIDNIFSGILQYIKGDTEFLPEVCLKSPDAYASSAATAAAEPEEGTAVMKSLAAMDIDKVGLSAILMYADRQDISDIFSFIQVLYDAMAHIPFLLLLLASLFLLCAFLAAAKSKTAMRRPVAAAAAAIGLSGLVCGSILLYFLRILPELISGLSPSLPAASETLRRYALELCKPLILFFLGSGLLFPVAFLFRKARKAPVDASGTYSMNDTPLMTWHMKRPFLKYACFTLLLSLIALVSIQSYSLLGDLHRTGFTAAYEKVFGYGAQGKVIPAINDAVYTLEVKLQDKNSGAPISEVQVDLSGTLQSDDQTIQLSRLSDSDGTARFGVQKGAFRISFSYEMLPEGYQVPDPVSIDISTAGTTTVTVSLDETEKTDASVEITPF